MTVREYIGARYVPLFMGQWDIAVDYEALCVVQYQGDSYTSRQPVPAGTDIFNEEYWLESGNYNAQVEAYRNEVFQFDDRITENANDISDIQDELTIINAPNWVVENRIADAAVTTPKIADAAVTPDKIADSFFETYLNYYTPEQFGAVGDGITDDTQAFIDMLDAMGDSSLAIMQSRNGGYRITQPLEIENSFCSFTSFERSENRPVINFDLGSYSNAHCLECSGTGNNFSNILFRQQTQGEAGNHLIYIDTQSHDYNVDYTFDNCVFYYCYNARSEEHTSELQSRI